MLDKLEFSKLYYKDGVSSSGDVFTTLNSYENEPESFCLAFQNHLSSLLGCSVRFEKASRGRLGRTFKCVLGNGKVLFCKTHRHGDRYKQIIEKEYYFLTLNCKAKFLLPLVFVTYLYREIRKEEDEPST